MCILESHLHIFSCMESKPKLTSNLSNIYNPKVQDVHSLKLKNTFAQKKVAQSTSVPMFCKYFLLL